MKLGTRLTRPSESLVEFGLDGDQLGARFVGDVVQLFGSRVRSPHQIFRVIRVFRGCTLRLCVSAVQEIWDSYNSPLRIVFHLCASVAEVCGFVADFTRVGMDTYVS